MDELWAQIAPPLAGVLVVVLYRLIDKYLPDPQNKHPLPPNSNSSQRRHVKK